MRTLLLVAIIASIASCIVCGGVRPSQYNLCGRWKADDGSIYYISHNRNSGYVSWYSQSSSSYVNVFSGRCNGYVASGTWSYIPASESYTSYDSGSISFRVVNANRITVSKCGGTWTPKYFTRC